MILSVAPQQPKPTLPMDKLPPELIINILSRLPDSLDLTRCRLIAKLFNDLSRDVRSINFLCTLSRYLKSRSPHTEHQMTPFKVVFNNLVRNSRVLESITVGIDQEINGETVDDVDDESDLYLTEVGFVEEWLPRELKSLTIVDFWFQSCWRKSDVLSLISSRCNGLVNLELKNAWLSVDNLSPIRTLRSLTLEFVRLDDEDLNQVNYCFPGLEVLNLRGVGGLRNPKINLLNLNVCHWSVSNAPQSLAICAPNLMKLKLQCIRPRSLVLETPLLCDLHLSLEGANMFEVQFPHLRHLELHSRNLCSLIRLFPSGLAIEKLTICTVKYTGPKPVELGILCFKDLSDAFPATSCLILQSGAWSQLQACYRLSRFCNCTGMKGLKALVAQVTTHDIDVTFQFILCILNQSPNLLKVTLLFHREADSTAVNYLMSYCTVAFPRVKWGQGIWKEEDSEDR